MALADLSIRRPVFAWMLMAAFILFGAVGFQRLGISQLPDVDFPVVAVSLSYVGAAPEVMESTIVDTIEDALTSIEGVTRITSQSYSGAATISVEFDLSRNIDSALQDVQAKIQQARRTLPTDLDPPVITKTNPEDQPILWLALTSPTVPVRKLSEYLRDTLKGQFATIPGVGDIRLGGYTEPALRVWLNPKALSQKQMSPSDVVYALQSEHLELPTGNSDFQGKETAIRTLGEATAPKDFSRVFVNYRGGAANYKPFPLTEVARVEDGLNDVRQIARSNGAPALGLGIQKQRGANAVDVAHRVKARLAEVQKTLPSEMKIAVRSDQSKFIEDAIHELNFTLILAAIATALVCWLFLGSWSATLNVILSIPTSVIGAFAALYFLGFTLNTFTLLALSLSIGIIVDDSIMVLENIVRRREHGEGKVKAALFGARQITFAAVAATVSILAIFLPIAFMKGIIGKYFLQFGITLSVAVILSLLEALTLTPMRCAQFLKVEERTSWLGRGVERVFEWLKERYSVLIGFVLRHRAWVIIGTFAAFGGSLIAFKALKAEFLPQEDQSQFLMRIKSPVGSSLAYTDQKIKKIEEMMTATPEVQGYFAVVGGFGGGQVDQGMAFVSLKPKNERKKSQAELMQEFRTKINKMGGVHAIVQDLSARGFSTSRGFPIEFTVIGPDFPGIREQVSKITDQLKSNNSIMDVDTDYQEGASELDILPDRAKAAARGVSIANIAQTTGTALGGVVSGKITQGGRRYDVRVKIDQPQGADNPLPLSSQLKGLWVRNNRGEVIPLLDVVRFENRKVATTLTRLNRQRAITVFANPAPGRSQGDVLKEVQAFGKTLPVGYRLEVSGTAQTFQESFSSLIIALILGIAVAYMVLATQFNSFTDPITVLSALPFSVTGASVALLLGKQTLNIYSMIGLLLLMGIVKKNSILLVEFTNQIRWKEKLSPIDALKKACPVRLRPIIMTSIATIVGALPAAIAFGPGAESRRPMAFAIIGGVLVSTVLTLIVVPCLYSFLTRKKLETQMEEELKSIEHEGAPEEDLDSVAA